MQNMAKLKRFEDARKISRIILLITMPDVSIIVVDNETGKIIDSCQFNLNYEAKVTKGDL